MARFQVVAQRVRALPQVGLRRLLVWLAKKSAEWRDIRGMAVGVVVPRGMDAEKCFLRIEQALALVETVVPYRASRLQKDLQGILCFGTGRDAPLGAYVPAFRMCLINPRYVLDPATTDDSIARTILHEATHARLHRRGIAAADIRDQRIEALCERAEADFKRRR